MKFKIDILVDGEPGVAQSYAGTSRDLSDKMTAKSFRTIENWLKVFKNPKVTGMALKYGSVNYFIAKIKS